MYQIVYSSRADKNLMSGPELQSMLIAARARNAQVGVSGILLHSYGRFLQLIEGDKPAVDALFARIEKDSRHSDLCRLDLHFPRRLFQDWSMAFVDVDGSAQAIAGFAGRPPSVDLHLIDEATAEDILVHFSERLSAAV